MLIRHDNHAQKIIMGRDLMESPFILRLVSVCTAAAESAGQLIRAVASSGNLGIVNKSQPGGFDPQTEADRLAQMCIMGKLEQCFPSLRMIGEEGSLKEAASNDLLSGIVPSQEVLGHRCPQELIRLDERKVVVWIDPLDGTNSFARGILQPVVISIGIATDDGKPIAGILHHPFYYHCAVRGSDYDSGIDASGTKTVWGIVGVGVSGLMARRDFRVGQKVGLVSHSHTRKLDFELVKLMGADRIVTTSGAAFKGLCVLEEEADILLYTTGGTKRWDTCAIDALFRAMGGRLTDLEGNDYNYNADCDPNNYKGVLATLHGHEDCLNSISHYLS